MSMSASDVGDLLLVVFEMTNWRLPLDFFFYRDFRLLAPSGLVRSSWS